MIAKLSGVVDSVGEDWLIMDVNGVGYLVFTSSRTLNGLQKGISTSLWIETVVREESISLYGFGNLLEKEWFLTLTKVQGVGSKVGLNILSALTTAQIAQAVAAQDKALFTRANGVGPKLAARLVVELKDKMVSLPMGLDGAEIKQILDDKVEVGVGGNAEDAISALVNLGYQKIDAYRAVSKVAGSNNGATVTEIIRLALKEFANKEA